MAKGTKNQKWDEQNIRERKIFQLGNGKYFQSELVNWEMAEEQDQEDKNKCIRPRERAHSKKKRFLHIREQLNA